MKIINKSQKKILFKNVILANNIWSKSRGLIFLKEKRAMFFKTRWGIHSFGVNYPLTILVCDNKMKVVKIKAQLKSNSFFFWNPKYKNIFELPEAKYGVKIGDKLEIEE